MLTSQWRKPSRSNWNEEKWCVTARLNDAGNIEVGDDKHPGRPPHEYTPAEWRAFVEGVKAGEFDLLSGG